MKRGTGGGLHQGMQTELVALVAQRLPGATIRVAERGLEVTYRGHTAFVRDHKSEGSVVFFGVIGGEHTAPARALLQLAGCMGSGGLALVEGLYVVRVAIPWARIADASLEDTVGYVSSVANMLGQQLVIHRPRVDPSTVYCGGFDE